MIDIQSCKEILMRLLTRADFDGLVCGVLLEEKGLIDKYMFIHPKDLQDGKIEVTKDDVLANVPYVHGCGLWFDHHSSEEERLDIKTLDFEGAISPAASAAQIIWDYYGGEDTFGNRLLPLLQAVNIADSASFSHQEIIKPEGWILISFLVDPRTGLGYYKDYRIGNYRLMVDMIKYCRTMTAEQILEQYDVNERVTRFFDHQDLFKDMLKRCSQVKDKLIITNQLNDETTYCGNRFMIYALFQDQNIDIRLMWGKSKQTVLIACGHSILNRSSRTNVGKLMLKYGGGGHSQAGTCQIPVDSWKETYKEIVETILDRE